ncbi:hypothetical protein [Demetria terragena]|uniref:hypothetical protein n=1 Tax=Demetria terragena TaxID=63959 RepID=UPI000370A1F7|nr:hypothetical protein [Demetria terragena]
METSVEHRIGSAAQSLPAFAGAMVAANLLLQIVIAARGNQIGLLAGTLTAVIAVGYAAYLLHYGDALGKLRFGKFVVHAITYACVNVGFGLHFFILAVMDSDVVAGAGGSGFVMDGGWFGAAVAMPALWGVGLVLHGVGAATSRGFEASR